MDKCEIYESDTLTITATVKNTGLRAGRETVQFYVRDVKSSVIRPEKELKGFVKVALMPGEEKALSVALDKRAFAYYDEEKHDWQVETGEFEILVGGSSKDTPLKAVVTVNSTIEKKTVFTRNSTIGDMLSDPVGAAILGEMAGAEYIASLPAFVLQMPLRSIHMQMPEVNEEAISGLIDMLNSPPPRQIASLL